MVKEQSDEAGWRVKGNKEGHWWGRGGRDVKKINYICANVTIMEKLLYSIGEVAGLLGENTSAIRFWTNSFEKFIKPRRNNKGNRQYTAEDIETLRCVRILLRDDGLTIEGASRRLAEDRKAVSGRAKALDGLRAIRAELVEVRKSL